MVHAGKGFVWLLGLTATSVVTLRGSAPAVFMLHTARVVRVSAPPIARGALILRDGLIEAVGVHLTRQTHG